MTYDNDIWRAYLTLHGFCSRLACLVCFLPLHDFRDLTNDRFSSHWWQYLTRHGMIGWYDIHDMTWHNVTWHDTTWHDETHMAWQYMPWGDTTLRDRQWHCVTVLYHSRIIPRHLFNRILHHNVPFLLGFCCPSYFERFFGRVRPTTTIRGWALTVPSCFVIAFWKVLRLCDVPSCRCLLVAVRCWFAQAILWRDSVRYCVLMWRRAGCGNVAGFCGSFRVLHGCATFALHEAVAAARWAVLWCLAALWWIASADRIEVAVWLFRCMCNSLLLLQLCVCRLHWSDCAKATTMSFYRCYRTRFTFLLNKSAEKIWKVRIFLFTRKVWRKGWVALLAGLNQHDIFAWSTRLFGPTVSQLQRLHMRCATSFLF